jgi:hypothetical protein
MVLEALRCQDEAAYGRVYDSWHEISEHTKALSENDAQRKALFTKNEPTAAALHQYFAGRHDGPRRRRSADRRLLPRILRSDSAGAGDIVYFQREVLKDVHVNFRNSARSRERI